MRTKILLASLALSIGTLSAQNYQVPISEKNESMMQGKFQPTWNSLVSSSRMVQKCEIRYLGALGAAMCGRFG